MSAVISLDIGCYSQRFYMFLVNYHNYCAENVKTVEDWPLAHRFFINGLADIVDEAESKIFQHVLTRANDDS